MAAAAVSAPTIDLKSDNSFPVRIGQSILKPSGSKKYNTVRYNHKPRLDSQRDAQYSIKPLKDHLESELVIEDGKGEYGYSGQRARDGDCYVLISTGKGKERGLILERLESLHSFNLTRTPTDRDAKKLAERYPHLPEDDAEANSLFGERDMEQAADLSNPFDYRNYLKTQPSKPKTTEAQAIGSPATTSLAQARPASVTPHSKPPKRADNPLMPQRKRKAQDTASPNAKRIKAGTEPPGPSASTKVNAQANIPKLRVERKATMRRSSLDDMGELILENETPTSETLPKRQGAMALALTGQLGAGPISLHSAASSPASRMESPMPERPEGMESGDEFELGESSPEAPAKQARRRQMPADDIDADYDEDADADVEDLELPSPVQAHHKAVTLDAEAAADDDDDLDKQLALAMAEDDEGDIALAPQPESEESEEE